MADKVEVGRVIFQTEGYPGCWLIQTLENHVRNVVYLAQNWDHRHALLARQPNLEAVIAAAEIHDMAKPEKFWLRYDPIRGNTSRREWLYSFSGHRFAVEHDDAYIKALALLHHTYGVDEITSQMARLKFENQADQRVLGLPIDLYVLEMCDQIEATVASAFLGSAEPTARVFMDFQFFQRSPTAYEIDPFVFQAEPLSLPIAFVIVTPPAEKVQAVEMAASDEQRYSALRDIKEWLLTAVNQPDVIQTAEVTLWSWT